MRSIHFHQSGIDPVKAKPYTGSTVLKVNTF
jgi:hypothetical protein